MRGSMNGYQRERTHGESVDQRTSQGLSARGCGVSSEAQKCDLSVFLQKPTSPVCPTPITHSLPSLATSRTLSESERVFHPIYASRPSCSLRRPALTHYSQGDTHEHLLYL